MFAGAPGAYGMPYGMPPSGMFAGPYGPPPGAFGPPPGAFGPPPGAFRPPPGAYGAPPPPGAFGPPQGAFGPPHDAHGAQEAGPVHLPKRVKPREDKDAIFKSKQPAVIRAAAGKVWADPKLAEWDPRRCECECES